LLMFVLGAIAVTAALGLYAVLVPDFGELQAKVLGTSAAISGASILVLACTPAWEKGLVRPLPVVASGLTVVALLLVVVGMWGDVSGDAYWKTMGSALILAVWAVLVCLLALARLAPRYRWTFLAASGITLALALVSLGAIWFEVDSDAVGRIVGVLAVLSAAFVVTVPVLSRASRGEVEAAALEPAGYCPRCGRELAAGERDGPCPACGARFRVTYVA